MESDALAIVQHASEDKIVQVTNAPQITAIRELKPTSYNKILEARVYRTWTAVTYGKKNESGFSGKKRETGFCCILIDQEGNAIQGNMNVREIDYFSSKIKDGSVYRISEFICEPTNPYQQTISNKTSLRFGRATKFNAIEAQDIPHHYFEFVSYNQLQYKVPKEDAMGRIQYPILTDYIGCLRTPGELKRKPNTNQGQTIYRKLDIENLSGNIVELTLWDDMAEKFEEDLQTQQQPVIIAVSSCRVTKHRDYQLTATSATYYYLNPQIPEAHEASARFKDKYQKNPPLRICKTPYEDVEAEKLRNRFPLKTLLKQEPETYAAVKFTTEATISSINIKRGWYYMSCNQCPFKLNEEDGMYRCLDHGLQAKPSYRYNFKGFIADASASVPLTFFSPAADDIVGYSCSNLIAKYEKEGLQEIPPEILAIEGKQSVFQIHYNTSPQTMDFVLDKVFTKKIGPEETTKMLEAASGAPSTPLIMAGEKDLHQMRDEKSASKTVKKILFEDELTDAAAKKDATLTHSTMASQQGIPLKAEESGSKTVTSPLFETDPLNAKLQLGTPPTPSTMVNLQDVKEKKPEESSYRKAKRPLFQDELADENPQKTATKGANAEKGRTKIAKKTMDN